MGIEVVSPGDQTSDNYQRDYVRKRREYGLRGGLEYSIVDPSCEVVLVLALERAAYRGVGTFCGTERLVSPSFEGLALTTEQVLRAGR